MATSNMTSLIDLAKTNQIAPVTQDFDESKGVAGRVRCRARRICIGSGNGSRCWAIAAPC